MSPTGVRTRTFAYSEVDLRIMLRDWNDVDRGDGITFGNLEVLRHAYRSMFPNGYSFHNVSYSPQDAVRDYVDGEPEMAPMTGGLGAGMPNAAVMTLMHGIPTYHYGISFSRATDEKAKRRGDVPQTQRYLYPGEDAAIIRTFFKEFIWPLFDNASDNKGIAHAQDFIRREAARRHLPPHEALQQVALEFDEASRSVAHELAVQLGPGSVVELHDMHFINAARWIAHEYWLLGNDPRQISVNWTNHIPFPTMREFEDVFNYGDDPDALRTVGLQMIHTMLESVTRYTDKPNVHIERYKTNLERARQEIFRPRYPLGPISTRHVQIDTEEVIAIVSSDSPEVLRAAKRLQGYARPLGEDSLLVLFHARKDAAKGPRELVLGTKQYLADIYDEFLQATRMHDTEKIVQAQADLIKFHVHCRMPDSYQQVDSDSEAAIFRAELDDLIREVNTYHLQLCEEMNVFARGGELISVTDPGDKSRKRWLGETAAMGIQVPGEPAPPDKTLVLFAFPGEVDGLNVTVIQDVVVGMNGIVALMPTMGIAEAYPEAARHMLQFKSNKPADISAVFKIARRMSITEANERMDRAFGAMPFPMSPATWQQGRAEEDIIPEAIRNRIIGANVSWGLSLGTVGSDFASLV
jgi:hypothetical protein